MNTSMIRYILGSILKIEAALLFLPVICAIIYNESEGFAFFITSMLCFAFGFLLCFRKPKDHIFYLKEGCITTALSWIVMSLFGAVPFVITGEIPFYLDVLLETVSGLTTTGASIV